MYKLTKLTIIKLCEIIKKKLDNFILFNFKDFINFTLIFKSKKYLKSTIKYDDVIYWINCTSTFNNFQLPTIKQMAN